MRKMEENECKQSETLACEAVGASALSKALEQGSAASPAPSPTGRSSNQPEQLMSQTESITKSSTTLASTACSWASSTSLSCALPRLPEKAAAKPTLVVDTIGHGTSSSASTAYTSTLLQQQPPPQQEPTGNATSSGLDGGLVSVDAVPDHLKDHVVSVQRVSETGSARSTTDTPAAATAPSGKRPDTISTKLLAPVPPAPETASTVSTTASCNRGFAGIKLEPPNRAVQPKRVVVCGAGIVGLTTCYYLVKQGHEVVCVDKEASVGTQVSLCNGAFLDPSMYGSWADLSMLTRIRASYNGVSTYESLAAAKGNNAGGTSADASVSQSLHRLHREDNSSIEVMGGPPACAASHDEEAPLPSASAKAQQPSAAPPFSTRTLKFFNQKPMKIEFNALRDPRFWTWGYHFLLNSGSKRANNNGRVIRQLGFYSMDKLRELQQLYGHDALSMDQTATGTIEVFDNERQMQMVLGSDRVKHLDELRVPHETLDLQQAVSLEPSLRREVYAPGALFSPTGTNGDVHKMCVALHELLRKEGVLFRFKTEIHEILPVGNRVFALQTTSGSLIEADDFVLALGNATAPLVKRAGIKLPIYPVKGYVLSVPVSEPFVAPTHNIYANGRVLVSPLGNTLRISGGVDFGKRMESSKRFEWLLLQAQSLFPDGYLDTDRLVQHVCWRPVTADDVPLIGRTKLCNLFVNAGHGSKGWTFAFGAGALLADEISGLKPQLDLSKFSPRRFGLFR